MWDVIVLIPDHCLSVYFMPQYKTLFENKPNMNPSFGITIFSEFENMNIDFDKIAEFKTSDALPWTFSPPRVLFFIA